MPRQEFERPASTPIPAQFESWCTHCDEKIYPGETIVSDSGDWVHDYCVRKPAKEQVTVCAHCWLAKPCGCDDVT